MKITEELREQVELIYSAPNTKTLYQEFGYGIGMLRVARICNKLKDQVINHYTEEILKAKRTREQELEKM